MQTEVLKVTGMMVAIDSVHDVKVTLSAGKVASEVNVQYDEQFTSPDNLKLAVKEAGFGIEADNLTQKFQTKSGCCG